MRRSWRRGEGWLRAFSRHGVGGLLGLGGGEVLGGRFLQQWDTDSNACRNFRSPDPPRFPIQVLSLYFVIFKIVITGASRGIGLATVLELARAGHDVVATMRNPAGSPELGEQAAKEKLPIRIETMGVDSDESVKQAFGRIMAHGPVEVLVNNAGIERTGSIEETPLADFRTCMETNYFGAIRCIQAVIGPMRERGSGAGTVRVWRTRGDCRAWHNRYADGPQYRGHGGLESLSASSAVRGLIRGDDRGRSGPATGGGAEDSGDRRVRILAVASSGGARRGAVPRLARINE